MITMEDYVGPHAASPDWTEDRRANAARLLNACAILEAYAAKDGVQFPVNPATGSGVSGKRYGGFRPQSCTVGAPGSAHKEGLAVDRFDPSGAIDAWCMANQDKLELCGIYIEHPDETDGWSHWSIRPPKSGRHVFYP